MDWVSYSRSMNRVGFGFWVGFGCVGIAACTLSSAESDIIVDEERVDGEQVDGEKSVEIDDAVDGGHREGLHAFVHQEGTRIVAPDGTAVDIRGVNLGGGFLWEGWMFGGGVLHSETDLYRRLAETRALGEDGAADFRARVDLDWTTADDLRRVAELGFNTVRIPFNHTVIDDPVRFARLDRIVDECEAQGLYVVLDLHAAPRSQNTVGVISDWNWGERTLWDWSTWEDSKRRTARLWQKVASRYRMRGHILGYDLLNEPDTTSLGLTPLNRHLLPEIYDAIIVAIRRVDPYHMVILEGDEFATDFRRLTEPRDRNMAYQFHMYRWTVDDANYDEAVAEWSAIAQTQQVPMFGGEFGADRDSEIRRQRLAIEADRALSGWVLWSWKSADVQEGEWQGTPSSEIEHGIYEIPIDEPWRSTIRWASGEAGAAKPSSANVRAGAAAFVEAMKFENTIENGALIQALF